jgi:hypothetical protein
MACNFVAEELDPTALTSGEFIALYLLSVYSDEAKSWRTKI